MNNSKPFTFRFIYCITYILSIVLLSGLMGYLIAECPCNKNVGTGFLFAAFCYGWIVISIVFHYHKLTGIHIGYSVLATFLVSIAATIIIVSIESGISYRDSPLRNYFLQWFATGIGFGSIHGIVMFVMIMWKEAKKIK